MAIFQFEGKKPVIGRGTFIHPEATIIGDVTIGAGCYVGAGARIRGDWGAVVIGDGSNIQENCVIHVYPGQVSRLGPRSHIGHGAILHTVTLGEHVLVGMGSILMDGVTVGDGCCIGAGSLLTEDTSIPPRKLVLGSPARVAGDVTETMAGQLAKATGYYLALPPRCHRGLQEIDSAACRVPE